MPEHLDISAHRELFHHKPRLCTGCLHARPRDAGKLEIGILFLERLDEQAAEQIAGSFARDDTHFHQRTIPRVDVARNSASARTSGLSFASGSRACLASVKVRPDL